MNIIILAFISLVSAICTCEDKTDLSFMRGITRYSKIVIDCDLYIFGGVKATIIFGHVLQNNLYRVDVCTGNFVLVDSGTGPSARISPYMQKSINGLIVHAGAQYHQKGLIFSRTTNIRMLTDAWFWDFKLAKWERFLKDTSESYPWYSYL